MPAKVTATAWGQNFKNAWVVVPVVLIGTWLLMKALTLTGESEANAQQIAFVVVLVIGVLTFLATWIYGRAIAGRVLLDCGPYPNRWIHWVLGIIFGLLCLLPPNSPSELFSLHGPWLGIIVMVTFFLVAVLGRLQVRENGIVAYWSLLRWKKIASYQWAEDCTLLITKKRRLSLRVALSVPPEQKDAVDELLSRFCPLPHDC